MLPLSMFFLDMEEKFHNCQSTSWTLKALPQEGKSASMKNDVKKKPPKKENIFFFLEGLLEDRKTEKLCDFKSMLEFKKWNS